MQVLGKLDTIARTASCRFQHLALDIIGLLRDLQGFGKASRSLGGQPPAVVYFNQIETDQQGQRVAQISLKP